MDMNKVSMYVMLSINYALMVEYGTQASCGFLYKIRMNDVRKTAYRLADKLDAKCAAVTITRASAGKTIAVNVELFTNNCLLCAESKSFHKTYDDAYGERVDTYTLIVRCNE